MMKLRSTATAVAIRKTPGDVVEIGVAGGNSIRVLREIFPKEYRVYGYDTFNGMPREMLSEGEEHLAAIGTLTPKTTPNELRRAGIIPVVGIFPDTIIRNPDKFPHEISFAHIDVDNYKTTAIGLNLVWPRLARQGAIAVHDFHNSTTPGVTAAVEDFMVLTHGAAIEDDARREHVIIRRTQ